MVLVTFNTNTTARTERVYLMNCCLDPDRNINNRSYCSELFICYHVIFNEWYAVIRNSN